MDNSNPLPSLGNKFKGRKFSFWGDRQFFEDFAMNPRIHIYNWLYIWKRKEEKVNFQRLFNWWIQEGRIERMEFTNSQKIHSLLRKSPTCSEKLSKSGDPQSPNKPFKIWIFFSQYPSYSKIIVRPAIASLHAWSYVIVLSLHLTFWVGIPYPHFDIFLLSILSFFKSVKNHEFFLAVCESVEEGNIIYRISDFFPCKMYI